VHGKVKPIKGKLIVSEVDSTGRYGVYFIPDARTGKAILVGTVKEATARSIVEAVDGPWQK
jgi:hypothetical protein